MSTAMVVGASGGIGLALTHHWLESGKQVIAVTRSPNNELKALGQIYTDLHILSCTSDTYTNTLPEWLQSNRLSPRYIAVCSGMLHQGPTLPEKRLSQVNSSFLSESININVQTTVLLAQALERFYQKHQSFSLGVLSAKVGSISDNYLGGWYSYRMSKAALNMLIRTLAIEWQRTFRHSSVVAIHPGTTNTKLSEPFQRNIPKTQLNQPEVSAGRIADIIEASTPELSGKFINWDSTELPW